MLAMTGALSPSCRGFDHDTIIIPLCLVMNYRLLVVDREVIEGRLATFVVLSRIAVRLNQAISMTVVLIHPLRD